MDADGLSVVRQLFLDSIYNPDAPDQQTEVYARFVDGFVHTCSRHPVGHNCSMCLDYRASIKRERDVKLQEERDHLRDAIHEVVETFRGATSPAMRAVVHHLHLALMKSRTR